MQLKYRPAFENPLASGITLFLSFCSMFALAVAILNFGRYGYVPEWSFYWSLYALVIHLNIFVHLEKLDGIWQYKIKLFKWAVRTKTFDTLTIEEDRKYSHVLGVNKQEKIATWITGNEKYRSTTLAFIEKIC